MFKFQYRRHFFLIKRNFYSLAVVFIVFALIFYFSRSEIKNIDCQINQTPCYPKTRGEFDEFLGKNFFILDINKKVKEVKSSHPQWKSVRVKKVPFHKVIVEITTRQPVACLSMGGKFFLLDKEGVVLNETAINPGLPEIRAEKFQEEEIKKALEVASLLEEYSLSFKWVKVGKQRLFIFLPETEVFLPTKDLPFKIASLQMIISRAKIEERVPKKIDLRFKKPVVVY